LSSAKPEKAKTTSSPAKSETKAVGSKGHKHDSVSSFRELIESFVVALVLAFFFKSFVAEVFVIPTGSMAPTLLGAHKDLRCPDCGYLYQVGASLETDQNTGLQTNAAVIGGICPLCRAQHNLDLRTTYDSTVMGDRIVVGKFNYLFADPKRWDVIVFKYPMDARINYIKRLIGCPNEEIMIRHGDIYVRPLKDGEPTQERFEIARKPVNKVETLQQPVFDSAQLSEKLINAGWPSNWQPWPKESPAKWDVQYDKSGWRANVDASGTAKSAVGALRFYHRFPMLEEWRGLHDGQGKLENIDPYHSTLITDYASYNAMLFTDRDAIYRKRNEFNPKYKGGLYPDKGLEKGAPVQIGQGRIESEDGNHWVGDLLAEFEVKVECEAGGVLVFDLVENGVRFECRVKTDDGQASWNIYRNKQLVTIWETAEGETSEPVAPVAQTPIRRSGSYRIKVANVDDQLFLWVNGKAMAFDRTPTFDFAKLLSENEYRPHWTAEDPLDAAPLGIALANGKMTVERTKVWRDVYYIAPNPQSYLTDYPVDDAKLINAVGDPIARDAIVQAVRESQPMDHGVFFGVLRTVYGSPTLWDKTKLFQLRNVRRFQLGDEQFFPMGDNSAASADARSWRNHYVPRELLIGKALVLLWPHSPVTMTPNYHRIGLIR
jgi:signal peptidase I